MEQGREMLEKTAAGFMHARILLTAIELDLFTVIGSDGLSSGKVSEITCTDRHAVERLLNALVALQFLGKKDGRFYNTEVTKQHLVAGAPGFLGDIMLHRATLWESWSGLTGIVRTGKAPGREKTRENERRFIKGMANVGRGSADQTAEVLEDLFAEAKRMLDIGGGPAVYACAFAERFPDLHVTVFDLPGPLEYARETIEERGFSDRVTVQAGDVLETASLGSGYDVVLCSNFIHSFRLPVVQKVIRKGAEALCGGGLLIVKDFFITEDRTAPAFAALFAVNMLAADAGDCFTRAEIEETMGEAGVEPIDYREVAKHSGILVGRKT